MIARQNEHGGTSVDTAVSIKYQFRFDGVEGFLIRSQRAKGTVKQRFFYFLI